MPLTRHSRTDVSRQQPSSPRSGGTSASARALAPPPQLTQKKSFLTGIQRIPTHPQAGEESSWKSGGEISCDTVHEPGGKMGTCFWGFLNGYFRLLLSSGCRAEGPLRQTLARSGGGRPTMEEAGASGTGGDDEERKVAGGRAKQGARSAGGKGREGKEERRTRARKERRWGAFSSPSQDSTQAGSTSGALRQGVHSETCCRGNKSVRHPARFW